MSMHIIRKALGLLIVDIVLIIGIFVLQFRTDSTILEKIGNLQITLALTEAENNVSELKNKLQVTFNGVNFYCDDQSPAQIMRKGSGTKTNVVLKSWDKDDHSFKLEFSEGVTVVFSVSSEAPDASLSTAVKLPSTVSSFYLPYNFNYNMKIQKDEGSRVIVDGRRSSWEMSAANLSTGYVTFTRENSIASYAVYDNSHTFSFEALVDIALANPSTYNTTVSNFKSNVISAFKANTAEANLTEQAVVSYVAAQAEKGNYVQAIEEIPQSFKKSKSRTYLSAPFFNNLAEMNVILDKTLAENEQIIARSVNSAGLEIFTVRNLAVYMYIHPNQDTVATVLQKAANADISTANLAQVTGILQVYVDLKQYDTALAQILEPVLEACVDRLEKACTFDGNVLTISENDTFLSVIQAVETGVTLMRYGAAVGNQTYLKAGYVIVNSYISESSSYDLRTLSNLYPILAFDNWYYPHFTKVENPEGRKMWAWTCSKSIAYSSETPDSMVLTVDFPENYTHYVIFKGVPAFKTIYIYNMAFRTDPRFERYNSSGYVYYPEIRTLLIKSRHKQRFETIRLELYGSDYVVPTKHVEEAPVRTPAVTTPAVTAPAEKPVQTETPKPVEQPKTEPVVEDKTETEATAPAEEEKAADNGAAENGAETSDGAAGKESSDKQSGGKKKKKH